jgi:hypothetical protein
MTDLRMFEPALDSFESMFKRLMAPMRFGPLASQEGNVNFETIDRPVTSRDYQCTPRCPMCCCFCNHSETAIMKIGIRGRMVRIAIGLVLLIAILLLAGNLR